LKKYSTATKKWTAVGGPSTLAGVPGANKTKFTGRLGKRALSPGRYALLVTAQDAAGNTSSPAEMVVRVLRPR
jgi:hypothetical protein